MYSKKLLNHFEHPQNVGELGPLAVRVEVQNPACGDVLQLSLRIEGNKISEARFRAKGCVPAIACGSALTELLKGLEPGQAESITSEMIENAVDGLPSASSHAAQLAIDGLRAALKKLPK
jgi:nitrogen fixation NifU-like protein